MSKFVLGLLLGLSLGIGIWDGIKQAPPPPSVPFSAGLRNYKIQMGDKQTTLRADRIALQDGCVLFYRQERIDTIICESIAPLLVTELYE